MQIPKTAKIAGDLACPCRCIGRVRDCEADVVPSERPARHREQKAQQEHREKLEQQRQVYMQEQEKLRRSHSQAVDVLNLKIQSLEARLQEGKAAHSHIPLFRAPAKKHGSVFCNPPFDFDLSEATNLPPIVLFSP